MEEQEQELTARLPNFQPVVGMPAVVFVLARERILLDYVVEPLEGVLDRGLREE